MRKNNPFIEHYTTLELLHDKVAKRIENTELLECARCGQDVDPSIHPEIGCDY